MPSLLNKVSEVEMAQATVNELVKALYLDLRESYPSITEEWLKAEAKKQMAGGNPSGGPGVFINDYLSKLGLLKG